MCWRKNKRLTRKQYRKAGTKPLRYTTQRDYCDEF